MTKVTECLDSEHDWRFSGDIKYCTKCQKAELNYDTKSFTLHFPDTKGNDGK